MDQASRKPLYSVIQEDIRERIQNGDLKPGDKIPTEHELKEQFKVSRMTISTAMIHLTKEGLIRRIPGKGTFVAERPENGESSGTAQSSSTVKASEAARNVADEQRKIGLVMPNIDSMFAMRIVDSVQRALNERQYSLTMALTNNSKKQERAAIRELIEAGVSGLIIFPVDDNAYNDEILSLKLRQFPFVLIDRYLPGIETHFVGSDNQAGARLAVSHLWDLGHRDIAVCSGIDFPTVTIRDRIDGYVKELTARGAMINPSLMLSDIDIQHLDFDQDHPLYRYIKARHATAYLALHNSIAILIYHAAKANGLKIPEDISIVSFDNPTSLQDEFAYFTYVDQSETVMGRTAAEMIVEIAEAATNSEGTESADYRKTVLQPVLKTNLTSTKAQS